MAGHLWAIQHLNFPGEPTPEIGSLTTGCQWTFPAPLLTSNAGSQVPIMQVKVARTRSFHQNRNLRERILPNSQVKKKLLNVQAQRKGIAHVDWARRDPFIWVGASFELRPLCLSQVLQVPGCCNQHTQLCMCPFPSPAIHWAAPGSELGRGLDSQSSLWRGGVWGEAAALHCPKSAFHRTWPGRLTYILKPWRDLPAPPTSPIIMSPKIFKN